MQDISGADDRTVTLAQRVEVLEDLVATLSRSVVYRDDEPYDAALCRLGVGGPARMVLGLVVAAILDRASGEFALTKPDPAVLNHPALDEAYVIAPIDRDEALRLIALASGDLDSAAVLLEAHRARGLGRAGHDALRASA